MLKMAMLKPGFQRFCDITHKGNTRIFHNLRNFHRTTKGKNQKQNRVNRSFDISQITGLNMCISPFAFYGLVGHTILEFEFADKKTLCLSTEGQQEMGEEYSLRKAIRPGYRLRYIRGTSKDIIGLRVFMKEKIFRYPVHLERKSIQNLCDDLIRETNKSKNNRTPYGLIFNNCTSSLWMTARKHLPLTKRHFSFIFNKFLPELLHKLGVVKLQEKKEIKKI